MQPPVVLSGETECSLVTQSDNTSYDISERHRPFLEFCRYPAGCAACVYINVSVHKHAWANAAYHQYLSRITIAEGGYRIKSHLDESLFVVIIISWQYHLSRVAVEKLASGFLSKKWIVGRKGVSVGRKESYSSNKNPYHGSLANSSSTVRKFLQKNPMLLEQKNCKASGMTQTGSAGIKEQNKTFDIQILKSYNVTNP